MKEEPREEQVPYYQVHRAHARKLSALFDLAPNSAPQDADASAKANADANACGINCENSSSSDDEVELVGETRGTKGSVPFPLHATEKGLIKRKDDLVSGDKPFSDTVCINIYANFYARFIINLFHILIY